jgi:hypothetical protein
MKTTGNYHTFSPKPNIILIVMLKIVQKSSWGGIEDILSLFAYIFPPYAML